MTARKTSAEVVGVPEPDEFEKDLKGRAPGLITYRASDPIFDREAEREAAWWNRVYAALADGRAWRAEHAVTLRCPLHHDERLAHPVLEWRPAKQRISQVVFGHYSPQDSADGWMLTLWPGEEDENWRCRTVLPVGKIEVRYWTLACGPWRPEVIW